MTIFCSFKKCHKKKLKQHFVRTSSSGLGTIIPRSSEIKFPTKLTQKQCRPGSKNWTSKGKNMNSINKPSLERLTFWFSMYQTFFSSLWIVQFKVFHFKHHFLHWHEGVKMHIKYYDLVLSRFEGSGMYIAYPLFLFLYHIQSL